MSEPLPQTWREFATWLRHASPAVWARLSVLAVVLLVILAAAGLDVWTVIRHV
jgi:hypothetical protein